MRWKLFATLAETAGDNEIDVPVEGEDPTLQEALEALFEHHPDLRSQVLDADDSLQNHIQVLCDGENPFHEGAGWETTVGDTDEIAVFPPVSGG